MSMRVIMPSGPIVDIPRVLQAIESTLEGVAKAAKVDFDTTTRTWKSRPDFQIAAQKGSRLVSTTDEIYGYVEDGTRPHVIAPKHGGALVFRGGYKAKTHVKMIGSTSGGASGPVVVTPKAVHHPGTDAREFAQSIADKWESRFAERMQDAIDKAVA